MLYIELLLQLLLAPSKKNTCVTDFSEYYIQEKKITGHA